MAHSLAQAGHQVSLLAMRIDGTYQPDDGIPDREVHAGVEIERLNSPQFFDREELARRIKAVQPDALVGATIYGSFVLAQQSPQVPFWADQFGHVMAEAQAKAHLESANWPLAHFWNLLAPVLRSADKLSVVSFRQRWAAVGELGLVGRLSAETCGYEFTSLMPCALLPDEDQPEVRTLLRGHGVPEDAFVSLWSGGYNVWSDVDTLFKAHEIAMEKDPNLHFVSTGGGIAGHDESTYARFEASVASSEFKDRYHLQGWVKADLVPSYQAEADLGVLCEIPMYEGLLGSKNRIVQWLGGGLPTLYNKVGDLGDLLDDDDLGLTFAVGAADEMAEKLLWAASHRDELAEMAARAKRYARNDLSFEATTADLVEWAESPAFAPDVDFRASIRSPGDYPLPTAPGAPEETAPVEEAEPSLPEPIPGAEIGAPRPELPQPSGLGRVLRRIFSFS